MRVTEPQMWNKGQHYSVVWTLNIITLIFGVLLNGLSLYLVVVVKKGKISMSSLIIAVNVVDFSQSLYCLLQCAVDMGFLELVGHSRNCESQSLILGFFTFWEAFTLAYIAYIVERSICAHAKFSGERILQTLGALGALSLALTIAAMYTSLGGYHLYSSGTYCFIDTTTPLGGVIFAFVILLSTGIMGDRYYRIWVFVRKAQALLTQMGMTTRAKAKYTQMAIRMSTFIIAFLVCSTPFLVLEAYEIITFTYAPEWLDCFSFVVLHWTTVLNPIIFFTLNDEIRGAFNKEFAPVIQFFYTLFSNRINPGLIRTLSYNMDWSMHGSSTHGPKGLPMSSRHGNMHRSKSNVSLDRAGVVSGNKQEWHQWIVDPNINEIFLVWCETNFVQENFLFYRDVRKHIELSEKVCEGIIASLNRWVEKSSAIAPNDLQLQWKGELRDLTQKIYAVYIETPTAPLEVNIPGSIRTKIQKVLGIDPSLHDHTVPPFPDVWSMPLQEAMAKVDDIMHVYDDAVLTISKVITTDVFPRFVRSSAYLNAPKLNVINPI